MSDEIAEVVESIGELSAAEQRGLARKLADSLPAKTLNGLTVRLATELPEASQRELAQQLNVPTGEARNIVWLVVVISFAVVPVVAVLTLSIAIFMPKPPGQGSIASAELVLTMFTSAVGFLAGLFVPSPTQKKA